MFAVQEFALLRRLRVRRRAVSVLMLTIAALWFAAALGQCLTGSATRTTPVDAATATDLAHCPANLCGDARDATTHEVGLPIPAADMKLPFMALLLVTMLWTVAPWRAAARIPLQPLLPKRPRTLKFYALRI